MIRAGIHIYDMANPYDHHNAENAVLAYQGHIGGVESEGLDGNAAFCTTWSKKPTGITFGVKSLTGARFGFAIYS
jgi:hypothetical protein